MIMPCLLTVQEMCVTSLCLVVTVIASNVTILESGLWAIPSDGQQCATNHW